MKKGKRRSAMGMKVAAFYERMKREEPEKWAARNAALGARFREFNRRKKNLRVPVLAEPRESCDGNQHGQTHTSEARESMEPSPNVPVEREVRGQDSCGAQNLLAYVVKIAINPRLVLARSEVCAGFEVLVGDNSRLWVDAPMWVRVSTDYPGYYELVGELPRGRWDRAYALRFE
jgi:hypothetical protein